MEMVFRMHFNKKLEEREQDALLDSFIVYVESHNICYGGGCDSDFLSGGIYPLDDANISNEGFLKKILREFMLKNQKTIKKLEFMDFEKG